ncbi:MULTISPECIES: DeoR family transcriptional regulator [Bacillus]|uniref:DeoR family transcriptional regulator n=1 Tax=Bacillus glycinifermentans TaxID=1664069 RepID=A0AAJ4D1K2_9BACI|nr:MULTISPECIES: DeoR family transcriptional regulator [Bacillus]KKB72965.1 DeoR faimly transcriptional regulator [Bacillus sp. TH008]MBU8788168.1 DeoR family transcriptional regulator [Bacillus glycinifermentans]MDU0073763.1 DeoR family transcriptional regulator [Bacillus sp. IG6]MED8021643.1 DeoR family transcriptional regulator [Bacillus glycinifermentans]NUJ18341.1 DeoR family transcriptional regulator [Bacillus glycinifermentans]
MLPIKRREQILSWIKEEETLRISEISKRLDVSEMTVYRDIKPLIENGQVIKTAGGIALNRPKQQPGQMCSVCGRGLNPRLSVQIVKNDGLIEQFCCAHCAMLRYEKIKEDISQIICRDFLVDTTISAKMAVFLLDADLHLNCCQPQAIPFASAADAGKFKTGFGGKLLSFEDAAREIQKTMKENCCSLKT